MTAPVPTRSITPGMLELCLRNKKNNYEKYISNLFRQFRQIIFSPLKDLRLDPSDTCSNICRIFSRICRISPGKSTDVSPLPSLVTPTIDGGESGDETKASEQTCDDLSSLSTIGRVASETIATEPTTPPSGTQIQTPPSPTITPTKTEAVALKHFEQEISWGAYKYKIEQNLPEHTTEKEWEQLVAEYTNILLSLNNPECAPGINRLTLSLDFDKKSISVQIPQTKTSAAKTIPIKNTTTEELFNNQYWQFKCTETLSVDKKTPSIDEETQAPPIGLQNQSKNCCATNSLIQMILAYPYLRNLIGPQNPLDKVFKTIEEEKKKKPSKEARENGTAASKVNTETVVGSLFTQVESHDIREALEKIFYPNTSFPDLYVNLREKAASILLGSDPTTPHTLTLIKEKNTLPLLTVHPEQSPMTLSQTIKKQKLNLNSLVDQNETINFPQDDGSCEVHLQTGEITQFAKAPKTLIIHADRNNEGALNTGKITLSQELLLPSELIEGQNETPKYQLRSFAVYDGKDLTSIHFVAYVKIKEEDGKIHYYKLNDSTSTEISEASFLKASENFTLAFYDKISPEGVHV